MNATEIIVSEMQRDGGFQMRQLLAERIGKPSKTPLAIDGRGNNIHFSVLHLNESIMVKKTSPRLKGWTAIAEFLGQTPAVAQRWHYEGMPVMKEGRFVYADPDEVTRWVGTDSGKRKPVHIASDDENLTADLKEGLSYIRGQRKGSVSKPRAVS